MGESFLIANLIDNSLPFSDTAPAGEQPRSAFPRLRLKVFAGPSNGEVLYGLMLRSRIAISTRRRR